MAKKNQNRSEQNFDFFFLYIYSLEKSEELWAKHRYSVNEMSAKSKDTTFFFTVRYLIVHKRAMFWGTWVP